MKTLRPGCALLLAFLTALVSHGADQPAVVRLWEGTAPGSEAAQGEETVRITEQGEHVITNVHIPTLQLYLPDEKSATGAAIVVCPGGGHRELWVDHEGENVGRWFSSHGVAVFVLKYRLARAEHSTYRVEVESTADLRRAIRIVRSRAKDWHVDPARVGVMGFAAGGELAARGALPIDPAAAAKSADELDRIDPRPAFQALIYPGNTSVIRTAKDAPPAFMVCGENDRPAIVDGVAAALEKFRDAGVPAELHVYAGVGHGFGIRANDHTTARLWPEELLAWLDSRGFLKAK